MNSERQNKIEDYGQGVSQLNAVLTQIPRQMWQFRPTQQDWSIHEIIIHLADSETNSYGRCRLLIAQPGHSVMSYNPDRWAQALDYHARDTDEALQLLGMVRLTTYRLIKSLPEEVWSHAVHHPDYDQPYTFDLWLDTYARHIPGHIHQIQSNYEIWQKSQLS